MADKLTERYTIPISARMRDLMENLDERQRERLRQRIRFEIARVVHEALFDPLVYLSEEPAAVQSLLGKLLGKEQHHGKPRSKKVEDD